MVLFLTAERKDGKRDGNDILDLHEFVDICHVEPSFFLNGVISILLDQIGRDVRLSGLMVMSAIGVHLFELSYFLRFVALYTNHVLDSISKINKIAYYEQF